MLNYFVIKKPNSNIKLSLSEIILNNYQGLYTDQINMFIAVLKQYICTSRCLRNYQISVNHDMNKLSQWFYVEKYLLYQDPFFNKKKDRRFYTKWGNIF